MYYVVLQYLKICILPDASNEIKEKNSFLILQTTPFSVFYNYI